jgi:photosystem II stability/assembly factor-like uncharacterized protein
MGILYLAALAGCGGGSGGGIAAGSGTLAGIIRDSSNGSPLYNVIVSAGNTMLTATTNSQGAFNLPNIPSGSQSIIFRRDGYQTSSMVVNILTNQTVTITLALSPLGTQPLWHNLSSISPAGVQYTGVAVLNGGLYLASKTPYISNIYQSADGGQTLLPVMGTQFGGMNALNMVDVNTAWAVGNGNETLSTTNGGGAWTMGVATGLSSSALTSVSFLNSLTGYVAGLSGAVAKTPDGGTTWSILNTGSTADFYAIAFPLPGIGFAAGNSSNIYQTIDDGKTWTVNPVPVSGAIRGLYAVDASHVWAVGDKGAILFYNGKQWVSQSSNTSSNLFAVSFSDTMNGWAVGDGGIILHTVTGGNVWQREAINQTALTLRAVYAVSPSEAWAAGMNGVLMHYSN